MHKTKTILFTALILVLGTAMPGHSQFWKKKKKQEKQTEVTTQVPSTPTVSEKDRMAGDAAFMDGLRLFMLEDYTKALDRFQKANALLPNNPAVLYKIAESYTYLNKPADAITYGQKALALDSQNPYYYLLLAQLYTSMQQYGEATKLISRLTKEVPNTEAYLFNLADLYLMQNRFDDAIKTYDRIEKKYGQLEEISFKKQQVYLRQNNLPKALQEGQKLIEENPNDPRYLLVQAELNANNNKLDDALVLVNKALKLDPTNAQARLIYAELLRLQGNNSESDEQLKQAFSSSNIDIDTKVKILVDFIRQLPDARVEKLALQLGDSTIKTHPEEAKAYAVTGDLQTITGKKQKARDNYLKAVALDNSHFKIWQQIVLLDAELNQIDSLVSHTDQALELFPNQAIFWFYNGTGHLIQKKYAKAAKSLEYGKKLVYDNKELLIQFNIQLGDSYHSLKEYAKSDAAYEEALAHDSNNAHVLNNYSYFLSLRNEKLPKAKQLAKKLVEQDPRNATYLDTYGWVLYKLQEYQDARKYLEQAVLNTSDATVLEHYGDVLFKLGQKDEAVQQWIRAKEAGGETSDLIDKKIKNKQLYE